LSTAVPSAFYADEEAAVLEGEIEANLDTSIATDVEEEGVDSASAPRGLSERDLSSDIPGSITSVGSTYAARWEVALEQQHPKRRVAWIPAAVAVAVTVGIVMIVALVLSGKRSGTKPIGSEQAAAPAPPPGMAYVRGGEFTMGSDAGDEYERPAHKVAVKSFFIDIYEVPCEEYEKFVKATGHKAPANWVNGGCPPGQGRKPVAGVDWYDATAYAAWVKKRLPTEEEWEFAARGTDGRKYPWGNEWLANAANAGDSSAGQFVDVGNYPDGKSPFGAMDMVGNAWEWTASDLHAYSGGRIPDQASAELKVIRGGFWRSSTPKATTTFRRGWDARDARDGYVNTGFRCAKDS
jgi:serine/threonine-protein kinase